MSMGDAGVMAPRGRWLRPMRGRSPDEEHRASTPLELLFDLCFVVAVSQAAVELTKSLAEDRPGHGVLGYAMVFFSIWWAWVNFTWFASAYDTDDVPYRLLTLLQMAGVLVLAAGVSDTFRGYDFRVVTAGYVVMRLAMVTQWLRAAAQDPVRRGVAVRYAGGIALVQVGWVLRLLLSHPYDFAGFGVLVVAEMCVPLWAEGRRENTPWHAGHIAERYGLFTIIVFGEVILATTTGIHSALTERGVSAELLLIAAGGLLLVFALWWTYFSGSDPELARLRTSLLWGYGHYFLFASGAALGAGLDVAVESGEHRAHIGENAAAFAVAVPVAVHLAVLAILHRIGRSGPAAHRVIDTVGGLLVLALAALAGPLGLSGAILGMGLVAGLMVAVNVTVGHRRTARLRR